MQPAVSTKPNQIINRLLQLGAFLQREGNRILTELGLTQQQFVVLNEIVRQKSVNQKQLIADLVYEKSNVSKIIKKLKAFQCISTTLDPQDRRFTFIAPTAKGRRLWIEGMARLNAWNQQHLDGLSTGQLTQSLDVLNQLHAALKGGLP